MDILDSRKLYLLRKGRGAVAASSNINLEGLEALQPRKASADVHFLPLPERLGKLLHQEPPALEIDGAQEAISRVEFEAFKQEVDAKIDLRNAEMVILRAHVLAMEKDIALIRKNMLRIKSFAVAGTLFILCWTVFVNLLF